MILRASRDRVVPCLVLAACLAWIQPSPALDWSDASPFNTNAATDTDSDYYLHFAHDDSGNWVCVWCAAIPASTDRDFDIMVSRSDDNAETWTAPTELDPFATAPPEIEDDFHPNVYTDGAGHWIAVWYSHDNHGGTIGDDVDILVSRSTDNGATWTSSVPLNSDAATDTTSDYTPDLAYDGNGNWVAVWYKQTPGIPEADFDVYFSRSTDHGATWSAMAFLHASMATDADYDGSPRIATDQNGHWVVVWTSEQTLGGTIGADADILFSLSTDGITWSAPAALNSDAAVPDALDDKLPRIVTDQAGRWVTVWYYGVYEIDYDIKVSHSDDNGATWSPVEYLNTNALTDSGRDLYPVPATDGNGNWVVVWQSKEPLTPAVGTDYDIFYSQSQDNAVTWSFPDVLNSYGADMTEYGYDRDPEVRYAGNGKWLTLWGTDYNLGGIIGTDYDLMMSTAGCCSCPGDLSPGWPDCNNVVNVQDFSLFALSYGKSAPDPAYNVCADLSPPGAPNGVVNVQDFSVFALQYGNPCP